MNVLIAGKYCLKRRIRNGSFGSIFMGTTNDTNQDIAIKLEKIGSKHTHLAQEWKALKQLNCSKRVVGIPLLKWYGIEGDYQVLVMELLGPNLEEIFGLCKRKIPLDTAMKMTIQIVYTLPDRKNPVYTLQALSPFGHQARKHTHRVKG